MYCTKCGFVTRGIEEKCPYCGTNFVPEKKIDHKLMFLGWLEVSPRQLVKLVCFNLIFAAVVVDLILNFGFDVTHLHFTPWMFFGVCSFLFLFNGLIFRNRKPKVYFLNSLGFIFTFLATLILSYQNATLYGHDLLFWSFGCILPIYVLVVYLCSTIYFIVKRKYNIWSTFFYLIILFLISTTLFVFTLVNLFGIKDSTFASVINYVSFVASLISIINGFILSYLQIKSKML